MKQYMLIFSLGSVQIFIEQARKTRDLWLGSFLIAKLMETAMREVEEKSKQANLKVNFVFPAERSLNKKYATLPHKYVAIFDNPSDASTAVEWSKEGMQRCWQTLSDDVRKNIIPEKYQSDETLNKLWDEQSDLDTCFETFWVIVEGDTDTYASWLKSAEDALEARKRVKDFQFRQEPGEKSTISGERQALHGTHQFTRDEVKKFWGDLATSRSDKDISKDGSERLDALDTIKRFASVSRIIDPEVGSPEISHKQAFPSTSSIATATFVERLFTLANNQLDAWIRATRGLDEMQPGAIPYLRELQRRLGKNEQILERDGDCYFKETFTARHIEKDYPSQKNKADEIANRGNAGLSALFAATNQSTIRHPTPYYAIVKMDGDNMGNVLSGLNREDHEKISKELSTFARKKVPQLIEGEYPGRLVYAGGDDVLALVPLARDLPEEERKKNGTIHTVLGLVKRLREQFGEIHENIPSVPGPITASAGIAIAHHYTALSAVLRATREAERLAKDRYDRNALVVTVMRRSGEQTSVGCHWEYEGLEEEAQPVLLFLRFYELFDLDVLSPKCIYTLLEEAPTLVILELDDEEKSAAQASEIKRVLRRQRNENKKDQLPDEKINQLARDLVALSAVMDREMDKQHKGETDFHKSVYLHEDKLRYGLVETLGWLLVMAFLARKEQD